MFCFPARGSICYFTGIAFSGCETLIYGQFRPTRVSICDAQEWLLRPRYVRKGSEILQGCAKADAQESRIQAAKRSDMGSTVMKGLLFADSQESHFQAAKRSNMCFAFQQGRRIAASQDSIFQPARRSYMGSIVLQGGRFADA